MFGVEAHLLGERDKGRGGNGFCNTKIVKDRHV